MEEIWKEWPKDIRYKVSNLGRVKGIKGTILKCSPNSNGYAMAHVLNNGKSTIGVHRMVMETFNPIENMEDLTVDHINGIRTDNRLENLRWVPKEENILIMMKNRAELNKELTRIINIYGYNKTLEILKNIS